MHSLRPLLLCTVLCAYSPPWPLRRRPNLYPDPSFEGAGTPGLAHSVNAPRT